MQHCNLVRQTFRLQQHDPRPSNLVSLHSQSLQSPVPASLVERYVTDCVQKRQADPVLLVTSQPGFDLGGVRDLCVRGHNLSLNCTSKASSSRGGRYIFDTRDQPLLAKQGPDSYQVETEVSTAGVKMIMTFAVKKNLWWRALQPPQLPDFQILNVDIEQQHHGRGRKVWFTLDHALECNTSRSTTIIVNIRDLPGLIGETRLEDATLGDTRCSIMSTKNLSSHDLQCMQLACSQRTATLTQEHNIDKSTEVDVYTIESCNGSGLEVKDLGTLKEWCSNLTPTNMTTAAPNSEHIYSQQMIMTAQAEAQPCHQPALVGLASTVPRNKRNRSVSELHEERQVSSAEYDALVDQMKVLRLEVNEISATTVNLQEQVGDQASSLADTQSVLATLLPVAPSNLDEHLPDTVQVTQGQGPSIPAAQASTAPETLDAISYTALVEEDVDHLLDNMAELPNSTLPDKPLIWPCIFTFTANLPTAKLKPVVMKALANVWPNGCSADSLAQQLWPEQYPRNDNDRRSRMERLSMSLKLTSVLLDSKPFAKVQNRIWTFQNSDARIWDNS